MARRVVIAGNWKMNKTAAETRALVSELKPGVSGVDAVDIVVCPPFTSLRAAVEEAQGSPISVGAQNVHWEESGAYTSEVSAAMLCEIPVQYVIIGHSERRQYFGETDETVNRRLKTALAAGLIPIVCIGEQLQEREDGKTESVVRKQVEQGFAGLSADQMRRTIVAYEPVWAIGTGVTATPEQAQETHAFVRSVLSDRFDTATADAVRILYGGSMKPANCRDLIRQDDIDGGLIGGASLKAADFSAIVDAGCDLS